MVEMADNSKLDLDHLNGFQHTTEKNPDNFIIDMESFSTIDDNINSNPRITLQRSLCRKGSSRGGGAGGSDTVVVPAASSSPRGPIMPEKAASPPLVEAGNTADHAIKPQFHHQITVSTAASNVPTDGRFAFRRNSFKRPPFSLAIDPKRVLFIFATVSSMGTILLIYFTLAMGKHQD